MALTTKRTLLSLYARLALPLFASASPAWVGTSAVSVPVGASAALVPALTAFVTVPVLMTFGGPRAGAAEAYDEGKDLHAANKLNLDWLRTALSLQRHTEWVSQNTDKEVADKLKANGWNQEGGIIHGPGKSGLQAYVAWNGPADAVVVSFRGTLSNDAWETVYNIITDAQFVIMKKLKFIEKYDKIKVHRGFYDDYEAVRDVILERVRKHPDMKVYVVGFSLGGALAALCALDIKVNEKRPVVGYFLAAPRVGGEDFRNAINAELSNVFRITLRDDPVPRIPGVTTIVGESRYEHVGRLLPLYPDGKLVPTDKIEARIEVDSLSALVSAFTSYHQRDAYRKAIKAYYDKCQAASSANCGTSGDILKESATAELEDSKER